MSKLRRAVQERASREYSATEDYLDFERCYNHPRLDSFILLILLELAPSAVLKVAKGLSQLIKEEESL